MTQNEQLSDAAIARKVLSGDREAFRVLVERHQRAVYHCVWRVVQNAEEAEDLAQEAFVRAYTKLGDYDSRWAFSTWLLTIATRLALNARRSAGRRGAEQSMEELPPSAEPSAADADPREQAAEAEWTLRLKKEIAALGDRMRIVFSLRHESGMSIREIAEATDSSESAVKVTLHRARKILRKRLREYSAFA